MSCRFVESGKYPGKDSNFMPGKRGARFHIAPVSSGLASFATFCKNLNQTEERKECKEY